MLALLSTISANVHPTASCLTMSSVCGTSFSSTENCEGGRPLTNRPARSCTEASISTLFTSAASEISNGSRTTLSRASWPSASNTSTEISRRSNGLSSTHSVAYGGPVSDRAEQLLIDVEADLPRRSVVRLLDLRDDADRPGQAGAAERRRDAHAQRRLLARARDGATHHATASAAVHTSARDVRAGRSGRDSAAGLRRRSRAVLRRTRPAARGRPRSRRRRRLRAARSSAPAARRGIRRARSTWLIRSRGWQPRS